MRQLFLFCCLFLFLKHSVLAQDIFINEVLIEPEQKIELFNNSENIIDLSGWYLDDASGSTFFTIPENSNIYPQSCLVFSDNFYLNKSSADTARFFDKTAPPTAQEANLIDSYSYSKSPGENISFQRLPDASDNWTFATQSLGLNNATKFSCVFSPSSTPQPSPFSSPTLAQGKPSTTPTPSPSPTLQPSNPSTSSEQALVNFQLNSIFLSEVVPNPDKESEWVELYNSNDFEIVLTDWFIDDKEAGGSAPKKFTLTIPAKGFASIELTAAIFNNSADSVRLLDNNQQEVDSTEYSLAPKNQSLSRQSWEKEAAWCFTTKSFNAANNPCLSEDNSENQGLKVKQTVSENGSLEIKLSPTPKTNNPQSKPNNFSFSANQLLINLQKITAKKSSVLGTSINNQKKNENGEELIKIIRLLLFCSLFCSIFSSLQIGFLLYNEFYAAKN